MLKFYTKLVLFIAITAVLFGGVFPVLISAASNEAVLLGVALICMYPVVVLSLGKSIVKSAVAIRREEAKTEPLTKEEA